MLLQILDFNLLLELRQNIKHFVCKGNTAEKLQMPELLNEYFNIV